MHLDYTGGWGDYDYEVYEKAVLISPKINTPGVVYCLEFYYHHSFSVDQINVKVKNESGYIYTLWTQKQIESKVWRLGQVDLNFNESFQVIFESINLAYGYTNDIALDDISFTTGFCDLNKDKPFFSCDFEQGILFSQFSRVSLNYLIKKNVF